MVVSVLSLAATLWAVVSPEPARAAPVASTYEEATCAALENEDDVWSRAAIGELMPSAPDCVQSVATPRAPSTTLDCEDILPWPGSTIGTCAVPRNSGLPGLRAAPRNQRHAHLELTINNDGSVPLAPPRVAPERAPFQVTRLPQLIAPHVHALASHWRSPTLHSHVGDVPLRPPQA